MVPPPPPSTSPAMTQRRSASRSRTVQITRPRRPATVYSSVTFSPGSSEWSVAPLTPREDGCHAGQLPGVVTYSKSLSGGSSTRMVVYIRVMFTCFLHRRSPRADGPDHRGKLPRSHRGIVELAQARDLPSSQRERSEERRVGKECRSRWSRYH